MSWTHAKCDACWIRDSTAEAAAAGDLMLARAPFRLRKAPQETCCWCGDLTSSGIYVREDPAALACTPHD